MMVLMLTVTTVIVSSCASNHPIDESKLPDLGNNTEQSADTPEETTSGQTQPQPETQPEPQQPQQEPTNNQGNTNANAGSGQNQTASEPLLSEDEAINIVLNKVPGAGRENLVSFGRDFDDGRWLYEGELIYNGLEYDFEIDAMTGNILEWEIDD